MLSAKKIIHILAAILLLTLMHPAMAEDAANKFSIGTELYGERYQEPDIGVQVNEHAIAGSLTGNYTHSFEQYFVGIDGRLSYANDDYKSVSGTDDNIPQYEGDIRIRGGLNMNLGDVLISPYVGLGTRIFYDRSNNTETSLGYFGYDRHITQYYAPIGVTSVFNSGDWVISPTIELDPLLYGIVNSHLEDVGLSNISNTQHSGYGIRGDFMIGKNIGNYTWQVGPFFRYWNIQQSNTVVTSDGSAWVEPKNNRLQAGAALKLLF